MYKMPDHEYVHREMAKSGVTLSLLWLEYCDHCREAGEIPYKSTQFNKYYSDYVRKTKATMHLSHKPGELMEVDWAGQNAFIVDTDTGELIKACFRISPAIQRLRLCGGIYVTESGMLDDSACKCLPLFWWRYPHPYSGQFEDWRH